jgi:hypothetical protein
MFGPLGFVEKNMRHLLVGVLILASLMPWAQTQSGPFGPSSYEDCVIDGAKSAMTKEALNAVYSMCRKKFGVESASPLTNSRQVGGCVVAYDGRKMTSVTKRPSGYKSRALRRDGVKLVTVYVPEEMDTTRSENWAQRMFIMAMDHCELSLF